MKHYRVQITHQLELPDDCELRSVAGELVLKMGEVLVRPTVEYLAAPANTADKGTFTELSESDRDRIYTALASTKTTITEI